MKVSDRFHKGPVQDLLNAVVVQAAEDYREYSAKLIVNPGSRQAAKDLEEVKSFFLSEDFCFYTKVGGDYILKKLEEEQKEQAAAYQNYKAREAELLVEARKCAKLLMQWQEQADESGDILEQGKVQELSVRRLISDLKVLKMRLPKEIRKTVRVMSYETLMHKAFTQLKEDVRNGKEGLRSGSISQPAESA